MNYWIREILFSRIFSALALEYDMLEQKHGFMGIRIFIYEKRIQRFALSMRVIFILFLKCYHGHQHAEY